MKVSRKQMAEVHAALQQATSRLCFAQQQLLKKLMSKNKLDTARPPGDSVTMPSMGLSN